MTATTAQPAPHARPAAAREPWPEIDRLTADAEFALPDATGWYAAVKVLVDYTAAAALLIPAVPLMLLAALAVRVSSRGPVFYTQTRLGLNGRRYKIIKIRTMHHNVELRSGIQWSKKDDNRVFWVGRVLRATHLDELPQLLNVLLGHMSLVGPRPERPEMIQAKSLLKLVPGYAHRLRVKPGVTGLAQVQLPADEDITSVRYKVVYDLYYAQKQSLWMDLRLLAATAVKAVGGKPCLIRTLFLLPDRDRVAKVFREHVTQTHAALMELQPA
jgi:lipopolysaccharide/colanic/teichoic acid biosynthesis glycosyltransferase